MFINQNIINKIIEKRLVNINIMINNKSEVISNKLRPKRIRNNNWLDHIVYFNCYHYRNIFYL